MPQGLALRLKYISILFRFDLRGTTSQGFRDEWHCHARAKPFVSRKLGHILKFIQHLEEHYFTNVILSSNNATDVPTSQKVFYSSYVELRLMQNLI